MRTFAWPIRVFRQDSRLGELFLTPLNPCDDVVQNWELGQSWEVLKRMMPVGFRFIIQTSQLSAVQRQAPRSASPPSTDVNDPAGRKEPPLTPPKSFCLPPGERNGIRFVIYNSAHPHPLSHCNPKGKSCSKSVFVLKPGCRFDFLPH